MDTLNPEYLFRQTTAQVRRHGARSGRATARNRRLRPAVIPPAQPVVRGLSMETTARAFTALGYPVPVAAQLRKTSGPLRGDIGQKRNDGSKGFANVARHYH